MQQSTLFIVFFSLVVMSLCQELFNLDRIPNGRLFTLEIFKNNATQKLTTFGQNFATAKYTWTTDFCKTDSDGDGKTNGDELGDPCCNWSMYQIPKRTNSSLLSDPSNRNSTTPLASVTATSRISNFSYIATSFSIELYWNPINEYENVICNYKIAMATKNGIGFQPIIYLPQHLLSYTKYNLPSNTTFQFRIIGRNFSPQFNIWTGDGYPTDLEATTSVDPLGQGVGTNCNWNNTLLFSSVFGNYSNWNSTVQGLIPNIYVSHEMTLLIDTSIPPVQDITIHGCFIVQDDQQNITISANRIIVAGLLQIGNETNPFINSTATITLFGERNNQSAIGIGNKCIAVMSGGVLSMHGFTHSVTWTRLRATALKGATLLKLQDAVSWKIGDKIVIASTDYDMNQAEELTIIDKQANDTELLIFPALKYMHYGEIETYVNNKGRVWNVSMQAEVGLLSHNIKVMGDASSATSYFGGHTIYMSSSKRITLSHVEFTRMGQRGILGRYPIHFHLYNNASQCYVDGVSIHHTYQRAMTFHGVHNLRAVNNVFYDHLGHGFFLEDSIEQYNIIEHNLGLVTRKISDEFATLTPTNFDNEPATFWFTMPTVYARNNVAAGSASHGFWYQLEDFPVGPSMTPYIRPRFWTFGEFADNVAHSNAVHGLNIWHEFYPCETPTAYNTGTCKLAQVWFKRFVSYKNIEQGFFGYVVGNVRFDDSIFIDNSIGYTFNVIMNRVSPMMVISNALFVGQSNNQGNPNCAINNCYKCGTVANYTNPSNVKLFRSLPYTYASRRKDNLIGIQFHRTGGTLSINNVDFFNYESNCERTAVSIDIKNVKETDMSPFQYRVANVSFVNSLELYSHLGTNKYPIGTQTTYFDMYSSSMILDEDGTLHSNRNKANYRIIPNNTLMIDEEKCKYQSGWNMFSCEPTTNWNKILVTSAALTNSIDAIQVSLRNKSQFLNGEVTTDGKWSYRFHVLDTITVNLTINWTGLVGTPLDLTLGTSTSARRFIKIVYAQQGPLQFQITNNLNRKFFLNPYNRTSDMYSYDCQQNSLTLPIQSSAVINADDADSTPPEAKCVTFVKSKCPLRNECGGKIRGTCVKENVCICKWGFIGDSCENVHCAHVHFCHGNGVCVGPNVCQCFPDFSGPTCRERAIFDLMARVFAFGDIHIKTLDGATYTFNSVGEFYFYRSYEFSLQARLEQCGTNSSTSCLKAISFLSGSDKVMIEAGRLYLNGTLELDNNLKIYINGQQVTLAATSSNSVTPSSQQELNRLLEQIKYQEDPSGVSNTATANVTTPNIKSYALASGDIITEETDASRLTWHTITFNNIFKGQIKLKNDGLGFLTISIAPLNGQLQSPTNVTNEFGGLYGTMNRDPSDDFRLRNGTVLPSTLSSSAIHSIFGESWRIRKTESLFLYQNGQTYESLNKLDFTPALPATLSNSEKQKATDICANKMGLSGQFLDACIFDVAATGDMRYAAASAGASAGATCDTDPTLCATATCVNYCSFRGKCSSGTCLCDVGYMGSDCSQQSPIALAVSLTFVLAGALIVTATVTMVTIGVISALIVSAVKKARMKKIHTVRLEPNYEMNLNYEVPNSTVVEKVLPMIVEAKWKEDPKHQETKQQFNIPSPHYMQDTTSSKHRNNSK